MLPVTALATYEYCKRKFYYAHALNIKEPPTAALLTGRLHHSALAHLYKSIPHVTETFNTGSITTIASTFQNIVATKTRALITKSRMQLSMFNLDPQAMHTSILAALEHDIKELSEHIHHCHTTTGLTEAQLLEALQPKYITEIPITAPLLNIKGRIDLLEIRPEQLIPIEYKTGTSPKEGVWPGQKLQAGAYALMLEEHYSTTVPTARIHYSNGARHIIPLTTHLKQEIITTAQQAHETVQHPTPPPRTVNKNKCLTCPYQQRCYA